MKIINPNAFTIELSCGRYSSWIEPDAKTQKLRCNQVINDGINAIENKELAKQLEFFAKLQKLGSIKKQFDFANKHRDKFGPIWFSLEHDDLTTVYATTQRNFTINNSPKK